MCIARRFADTGQSFPDKKHQEVVRAVDDLLLQRPAKDEHRW